MNIVNLECSVLKKKNKLFLFNEYRHWNKPEENHFKNSKRHAEQLIPLLRIVFLIS